MAKLPPGYVKAPTARSDGAAKTSKRRAPRKKKKAGLLDGDGQLVNQVMVELSDDERRALESAREELSAGGTPVTLAEMVHRAVGEWIASRQALKAQEQAQAARAEEPVKAAGRRAIEAVVSRLRSLAADPVSSWRELMAPLRWLASGRAPDVQS